MPPMRVGLVGTGIVGTHVGLRLIEAGHTLTIHDLEPEAHRALAARGAAVAASPRDVAAASEVVITAVPRGDDARAVALGPAGLAAGAAPGLVHVEMSTIGPDAVRELDERERAAGLRLIDAPLSAGPQLPDRQELTLWIGAPGALYAECRALLGVLAEHVVWCGPVGHGQAVKLVNNALTLLFSAALGDALCLGVKAGVPLEILRIALFWGTAQNRLMDDLFPRSVFVGDWRPGYTVDLAEKDWRLALDLAAKVGAPLPDAPRIEQAFRELQERGWSEASVHAIVRLAEDAAGVKLRMQGFADRP